MTAPAGLNEPVSLEFRGTPLQWLRWMLLAIGGALLVVPLAWVTAAIARWACRNTTFSDGTTVEFRGTGDEVVVWHVFYIFVLVGHFFLVHAVDEKSGVAHVAIMIAANFVMLYILLMLIKWFVYNVKIAPGPAMSFAGGFLGLLGWSLLVALSVITIVGWAWALAGLYRWMAENVKGRGVRFEFHGKGHEILWRVLATVAGSVVIVTIPWLTIWLKRWLVEDITFRRVEENEWLSDPSEPRVTPKPSLPKSDPILPIG